MSLLFNMLSILVIASHPRSKHDLNIIEINEVVCVCTENKIWKDIFWESNFHWVLRNKLFFFKLVFNLWKSNTIPWHKNQKLWKTSEKSPPSHPIPLLESNSCWLSIPWENLTQVEGALIVSSTLIFSCNHESCPYWDVTKVPNLFLMVKQLFIL